MQKVLLPILLVNLILTTAGFSTTFNVKNVKEFRFALEDATANGESDRIILNKGTYKINSDKQGTFTFDDNEEFNLTIEAKRGLGSKHVILSGEKSAQVFNFNNTQNSTLILKNITVQDGNHTYHGGGVFSNQNIKLEKCKISNNEVSGFNIHGGGFYAKGRATITDSSIINNRSFDYAGGFYSNYATIKNSLISNNKSINSLGGGFYSATVVIDNSIISNNSTGWSSGGFRSVKATIRNSKISNNRARGNDGGGFISNEAIIENTLISNNRSGAKGGGFVVFFYVRVTNSVFVENNASEGAIFHIYPHSSNRDSHISNNNFINNRGGIFGRGIIVNNIFSKNDQDVSIMGISKIYNNYIDYSKIEDNGYNVIKKRNLQPISVGTTHLAKDNKTPTSKSPFINKGLNPTSSTFKQLINNDTIYAQLLRSLKSDFKGNRRVYKKTIDMGAVEYGSSRVATASSKNDLNGDGIVDIIWRKNNSVYVWYMNSDGTHTYKYLGGKSSSYKLLGIADFNDDGIADILWRKGSKLSLWYMNSDGTHTYKYIGSKSTSYKMAGTADFNGDGIADIFWRKGALNALWYMKKDGKHAYKYIGSKSTSYKVADVADFNDDGKADILWRNGSVNALWYMRSTGKHSYKNIGRKSTSYRVEAVADFNGDGIADIFWKKGSLNALWYMKKDGKHSYKNIGSKSTAYKVASVADFNGDGKADILWKKKSGNYLWYMNANGSHKYKNIGAKASSYVTFDW